MLRIASNSTREKLYKDNLQRLICSIDFIKSDKFFSHCLTDIFHYRFPFACILLTRLRSTTTTIPRDAAASNIYVVLHLKESPLVALLSYARKFLRKDRPQRQIAILPALQFCRMAAENEKTSSRDGAEWLPTRRQSARVFCEADTGLQPCRYFTCQPIFLTF